MSDINSVLEDFKDTFKDIQPGETKTFSFSLDPQISTKLNEMARTSRSFTLTDNWEEIFDNKFAKDKKRDSLKQTLKSFSNPFTPTEFGEKAGLKNPPTWNKFIKALEGTGVITPVGSSASSPKEKISKEKKSNKKGISPTKKAGTRVLGELAEGSTVLRLIRLLKKNNIQVEADQDKVWQELEKRKKLLVNKSKENNWTQDEIKTVNNAALGELKTGENLADALMKQLREEVKDLQFCKVKIDWEGGEGNKTDIKLTVTKPETNKMVATFLNSIKTGNISFRLSGTDANNIAVYLYRWFAPDKMSPEFNMKGGKYSWDKFFAEESNKYEKIKRDIPEFTEFCDLKIKELEEFKNVKSKGDFTPEYKDLHKKINITFANNLQKAFDKYGKESRLNFLSQQGAGGDYNIFVAIKDRNNKVISKYTSPQFKTLLEKFIDNSDLEVVSNGSNRIDIKLGGIKFVTIELKKEYQKMDAQMNFQDFN